MSFNFIAPYLWTLLSELKYLIRCGYRQGYA